MTARLLIAGVLIFVMVVAGVWLVRRSRALRQCRWASTRSGGGGEARQTLTHHGRASSAIASTWNDTGELTGPLVAPSSFC
jgi:hypothetical protein